MEVLILISYTPILSAHILIRKLFLTMPRFWIFLLFIARWKWNCVTRVGVLVRHEVHFLSSTNPTGRGLDLRAQVWEPAKVTSQCSRMRHTNLASPEIRWDKSPTQILSVVTTWTSLTDILHSNSRWCQSMLNFFVNLKENILLDLDSNSSWNPGAIDNVLLN